MGISYLRYKKAFNRVLKDDIPILDRYGNKLEKNKKEKWIQCYHPKDKVRRSFPKHLFVSNMGNVVSVFYADKPKWLIPSLSSNNREGYVVINANGKKQKDMSYLLVAVCHGSKTFGKADEMMAEKGRKAFGRMDEYQLQVHHDEGFDKDSRAASNNPETLTILTINIHQLFRKVPSVDASVEEEFEFMREFASRIEKETDQPVIMIPSGKDYGTIREFFNDDTREWLIFPIGKPAIDVYTRFRDLVTETLIDHYKDSILKGSQVLRCIDFNERICLFFILRK